MLGLARAGDVARRSLVRSTNFSSANFAEPRIAAGTDPERIESAETR